MDPLAATAHRPWPLPSGPWIMRQRWERLLFLHWAVPAAALRPRIPAGLELEEADGAAWLGLIPFRIRGLRFRGLPPLPTASSFRECNLRTYVRAGGKPGVWFFSLDASSALAVLGARLAYSLPYHRARATLAASGDRIHYVSQRRDGSARLELRYGPIGPATEPGPLARWLTERYCLYAAGRRGRLWRAEIHHLPWPLQPAWAELQEARLTSAERLPPPATPPLLHYAAELDVRVWAPARVGR